MVGGLPWQPEGLQWEPEAASTDDWSTGEWFDATWAHFRTEEQLNRFKFRSLDDSGDSEDSNDAPHPRSEDEPRTSNPSSRRGGTGRMVKAGAEESSLDLPNPLHGVDIDKLVEEVKQYDVSSDSQSYDSESSSDSENANAEQTGPGGEEGRFDHGKMQECIETTQEAEEYFEQLHIDDPKEMGVLCRRDEWNATKYLGITPEQDAANKALWDACIRDDIPAIRRAIVEYGAQVDAANWQDRCWRGLHYSAYFDCPAAIALLIEEYGAVVDVPDIEGYTPLHRAVDSSSLLASKVLVALGAEVRLETHDRNWAYSMTLLNRDPTLNNFIEKVVLETGPYPLEPEDDELSIEMLLEEERKAREEGGEEAAEAVREARRSNEGMLKAFCRKRERRRRAFRNYKKSLLMPGEMPEPGSALAARHDVARRVAAVHKRMMARIQADMRECRRLTRFPHPKYVREQERAKAAAAAAAAAPHGGGSRGGRGGRGGGPPRGGREFIQGGGGGGRNKRGQSFQTSSPGGGGLETNARWVQRGRSRDGRRGGENKRGGGRGEGEAEGVDSSDDGWAKGVLGGAGVTL